MKTRHETSAGGVIYRWEGNQPEVCLISVRPETWQLPKGLIEEGEPREETARREVREETGLDGELVAPLDKIQYWYVWDYGEGKERINKQVYFYLFRCTGGSTDDHDHEVLEARWFTVPEARKVLSYENERRIFEQAVKAITALHAGD